MGDEQSEPAPDRHAGQLNSTRNPVLRWLRNVPVSDPVDLRNAPALQLVLLLLGTTPALLWLYRVVATDIPWRPGELGSMLLSLAVCAVAIFSFLLIRRGHFQWAIRQMLVVIAVAMIAGYAAAGPAANAFERPLQVVWIALAGLMIGRRALWMMYAAVVAAYLAGAIHDNRFSASPLDTAANLTMAVLVDAAMFLFIALVVDRGVKALHDALAAATHRGDALDRANRRMQEEMADRKRAEQQLVHAQKVEVVGHLASGIAHDFNHLLSLIMGFADRGKQSRDPAEMRTSFADIEASGRRAIAITRKLLDFSRQDATRIERIEVGAAMQAIQPLLRQLFDPLVRISHRAPQAPLEIDFDRAQLDLVVLNIAANANQAMPEGGEFHLGVSGSDDGVEIELRDTGHGMDEAVQQRLFEPFFTTRPAGGGTGLGLAVARDLVDAAGGSIAVDSAPGRGSTFRLRFARSGNG